MTEEKEHEVIEPQELALPSDQGGHIIRSDAEMEAMAEQVKRKLELQRRAIQYALASTRPADWLDVDGKPYLQATGAEKLMKPFGLSILMTVYESETRDLEDGHQEYMATCQLTIEDAQGTQIRQVGTARSTDPIFGVRYNWIDGKKVKIKVPLSEINIGDVKKKAYTNAMNRAVKSILGISGYSWEDLAEMGIQKGKAQGYQHKTAAKSAETSPEQGEDEKKMRMEITDILLNMNDDDKDKAKAALIKLTEFPDKETGETVKGLDSTAKLKGRRLEVTLGKARKAYQEAKGKA